MIPSALADERTYSLFLVYLKVSVFISVVVITLHLEIYRVKEDSTVDDINILNMGKLLKGGHL